MVHNLVCTVGLEPTILGLKVRCIGRYATCAYYNYRIRFFAVHTIAFNCCMDPKTWLGD